MDRRAGFEHAHRRSHWRLGSVIAAIALILGACGGSDVDIDGIPELPPTDPTHLAETIRAEAKPAVVNVWASWCVPCRSEAPLLRTAAEEFATEVTFVGVDVADTQANARAFIAEFDLTNLDHYFDPDRSVPAGFGRVGVPLTFFLDADAQLVEAHSGVIDERTLAEGISLLLGR
jgi:thiol-disulfide isomerase/thioredoxin